MARKKKCFHRSSWSQRDFQYISEGFNEVSIGTVPLRVFQGKKKQYGLKHNVIATIDAVMDENYIKVATSISDTNTNLSVWEKGMLVIFLSRTKFVKDSIILVYKNHTLKAFRKILTLKIQLNYCIVLKMYLSW